jgi:hypothetical protein
LPEALTWHPYLFRDIVRSSFAIPVLLIRPIVLVSHHFGANAAVTVSKDIRYKELVTDLKLICVGSAISCL